MAVASALPAIRRTGIGAVYLRGIPGKIRLHQTVGAQAQTLSEAFNADAAIP